MKAIYKILNNNNGKFYIGSAQNLRRRWKQHESDLKRGNHKNPHLQHAWNKDGENFTFLVLEEVEKDEDLIPAEQKWLDLTRSYERGVGYNICPTAGSSLGRPVSQETRKKLHNANKGTSPWTKGRSLSQEHRRKIGEAKKGRSISEEHRRKIGEARLGKGHNAETKRKIGEAKNGEKHPQARLTWEKVREMRTIYARGGISTRELGRQFGVSQRTAWKVVNHQTWTKDPKETA
jgi:group I intron endonuclease